MNASKPNPIAEPLWQHLRDKLMRYFAGRVRDHHAVEDLVQETFRRVHERIGDLQDHQRLDAWVFGIARRLLVDRYRLPSDQPLAADVIADADDSTQAARLAQWLPPAIDALPERYRQAIRLHEIDGLSQKQVAEQLGLSVPGAKSRIGRGRAMLKQAIERCCAIELDRRGNVTECTPRSASSCPTCE